MKRIINKIGKFSFVGLLIFSLCSINISASSNETCLRYGFTIDSEVYDIDPIFLNTPVIYYSYYNSIIIGAGVFDFIPARAKNIVNNKYQHIALVRYQMEPRVQYKSLSYYRGLNDFCNVKLTLDGDQTYVNYAPTSNPPTSTETWSVNFAGNANTNGEIGVTAGIGFTTSTTANAYDIYHTYNSSTKVYDITYEYHPSQNIFNLSAKRAINRWLTNTHQCFFVFAYDTNISQPLNSVGFDISFAFRPAVNSTSSWNGSCNDVRSPSSAGVVDGWQGYTHQF